MAKKGEGSSDSASKLLTSQGNASTLRIGAMPDSTAVPNPSKD